MTTLDKRLHAYRSDLADESLRDYVEAKQFVSGVLHQVVAPLANVHAQPAANAMQLTQALKGEIVRVLETVDGWAWCQLIVDGYVGYVKAETLSATVIASTHRVSAPSTLLFPDANLKSQPTIQVTFKSALSVVGQTGDFLELATGGYVFAAHCVPIATVEQDPVAAAEKFLGTPYLWGGKGIGGIDCSGLVQVAFESTGLHCLRDSDMQEKSMGTHLQINDLDGLKRGDLVFWDGHVGLISDATTLLHANGHHMMVVKEPLREAVARLAAKGQQVTSIKRVQ